MNLRGLQGGKTAFKRVFKGVLAPRCNFIQESDGSYKGFDVLAGFGYAIRKADGDLWVIGGPCRAARPSMTECISLLERLRRIKQNNLRNVLVEMDAESVINFEKGTGPIPWFCSRYQTFSARLKGRDRGTS